MIEAAFVFFMVASFAIGFVFGHLRGQTVAYRTVREIEQRR